ncbi:hypothetical protein KSC_072190 [Ktedonobacter sp. SOSP1-52]|nr:hypothetical protein KSC_072190 [Ktedonobacter sp. SOSP1-52]
MSGNRVSLPREYVKRSISRQGSVNLGMMSGEISNNSVSGLLASPTIVDGLR